MLEKRNGICINTWTFKTLLVVVVFNFAHHTPAWKQLLSILLSSSEILKFWNHGQSKVYAVQWIEVKYQGIDGNKKVFYPFLLFWIFRSQLFQILPITPKSIHLLHLVSSQIIYFPYNHRKKITWIVIFFNLKII